MKMMETIGGFPARRGDLFEARIKKECVAKRMEQTILLAVEPASDNNWHVLSVEYRDADAKHRIVQKLKSEKEKLIELFMDSEPGYEPHIYSGVEHTEAYWYFSSPTDIEDIYCDIKPLALPFEILPRPPLPEL